MSGFDSALRHIRIIEKYWKERGYTVEPRIVAVQGNKCLGTELRYEIQTDMKNGWPCSPAKSPATSHPSNPVKART